jgi:hypothetical protein
MRKQTWMAMVIAVLLGPGAALAADGWTWLPSTKNGYQAEPTVAVMLGRMSPGDEFRSATIIGAELSMNCFVLQPPVNRIRQQFSFTHYDKGRVDIYNIEANPHYVVEIAPGFEIGGGPGFALVMVDTPGGDGSVLGLQLGASAHYHGNSPLFVGAEARYQITDKDRFGGAGSPRTDVNNFRFVIKVGYSF